LNRSAIPLSSRKIYWRTSEEAANPPGQLQLPANFPAGRDTGAR
jgi:hypothetical protein